MLPSEGGFVPKTVSLERARAIRKPVSAGCVEMCAAPRPPAAGPGPSELAGKRTLSAASRDRRTRAAGVSPERPCGALRCPTASSLNTVTQTTVHDRLGLGSTGGPRACDSDLRSEERRVG